MGDLSRSTARAPAGARRYLVEEVEPLDVRLFCVEELLGDVQELMRL